MASSYAKRLVPQKTEQQRLARTEDEVAELPHPRAIGQHNMLQLQRIIGNQGVQAMLARQSNRAAPAVVGHMQRSSYVSGAMQRMIVQRDEADSDDDNQLNGDESGDNQAATPQGVQVQEIDAPHGSVVSSSRLNNTNSNDWNPFIKDDVLLFGYTNIGGHAATVNIELKDNTGNGAFLASGSVSWQEGDDGERYLEFRGFPPRDDGSVRDQCNSITSLTNDTNASEGYEVLERIYSD